MKKNIFKVSYTEKVTFKDTLIRSLITGLLASIVLCLIFSTCHGVIIEIASKIVEKSTTNKELIINLWPIIVSCFIVSVVASLITFTTNYSSYREKLDEKKEARTLKKKKSKK